MLEESIAARIALLFHLLNLGKKICYTRLLGLEQGTVQRYFLEWGQPETTKFHYQSIYGSGSLLFQKSRLLSGIDEFINLHGESEITRIMGFDPWSFLANMLDCLV